MLRLSDVRDSASSEPRCRTARGWARVPGNPDDLVGRTRFRFDLVNRELRANVIFERKQDRVRARARVTSTWTTRPTPVISGRASRLFEHRLGRLRGFPESAIGREIRVGPAQRMAHAIEVAKMSKWRRLTWRSTAARGRTSARSARARRRARRRRSVAQHSMPAMIHVFGLRVARHRHEPALGRRVGEHAAIVAVAQHERERRPRAVALAVEQRMQRCETVAPPTSDAASSASARSSARSSSADARGRVAGA